MTTGLLRRRAAGRTGLALFLNAGDPPLDVFRSSC